VNDEAKTPGAGLIMSVSGVRGIVGESLTPSIAAEVGAAFGSHVGGGAIVLGRDTRTSGEMIQAAVSQGLVSTGCHVIELGIASTPGTALMIGERRAAGGIVITASHNPIEWNGVKFLSAEGRAPAPDIAERIFAIFRGKAFLHAAHAGQVEQDESTAQRHVARVLQVVDVECIRRRSIRVVLDSVNGAGGAEGRLLLERLGCDVVHVNAEPTGHFAHMPEPTAEN
jgi:phosphomannomutase